MVRVWLSVNLKRHGVDCGGTVGGVGPGTRADRSRTWPHLGHNLDTGANPFNVVRGARESLWLPLGFEGTWSGPRRCRDGGQAGGRSPRSRNRRDMRVSELGLGATMNAAEYQHV